MAVKILQYKYKRTEKIKKGFTQYIPSFTGHSQKITAKVGAVDYETTLLSTHGPNCEEQKLL